MKSGHHPKLTFSPIETSNPACAKRKRKRDVIWFTPPYSAALKTNFGRQFLNLIDKNFPVNNPLHKILNRKTIKISYSCTQNMQTILQKHNRKVLDKGKQKIEARCNCQVKALCPVPDECCQTNVVYHATVKHDNGKTAQYFGSTEPEFKYRYNNHNKSFRHEKYQSETTLSKYVWDNGLNPEPNVKWKFIKKCSVYENGMKSCDLCLSDKFFIIKNLHNKTLINKRTDIGNRCPHRRKCMLKLTAI